MGTAPGQVPASPVTNARVYASVYSSVSSMSHLSLVLFAEMLDSRI
jgi:hypothetical protein